MLIQLPIGSENSRKCILVPKLKAIPNVITTRRMRLVLPSALCAALATIMVAQAQPLANAEPRWGWGKREAEPYGHGGWGKREAEPYGHGGWGKREAEP